MISKEVKLGLSIFCFALLSLAWAPAAAQKKSGQAVKEPARPAESAEPAPVDRISVDELKRKLDRQEKVLIIDGRAGNSYLGSSVRIKGAIHITVDELASRIPGLPKNREIVIYCT